MCRFMSFFSFLIILKVHRGLIVNVQGPLQKCTSFKLYLQPGILGNFFLILCFEKEEIVFRFDISYKYFR